MDPNTALEFLRATTRMINGDFGPSDDEELARHARTMAEHWEALDDWIKRGGFLPDAWKR